MHSAPQPAPPQAVPESPWPGPALMGVIALILRATLGFALLSEGLAGYFVGRRAGMPAMGNLPMFYQQAIPVAQICIGLALIVGIGTVIAAVAAALLGLGLSALVLFQAFITMTTTGNPGQFFTGQSFGGPQFFGNAQFFGNIAAMTGLTTAIATFHQVAVIAMGKPAINRFSIDALIFRSEEPAPLPRPTPPRFDDGRRELAPDDDLIA